MNRISLLMGVALQVTVTQSMFGAALTNRAILQARVKMPEATVKPPSQMNTVKLTWTNLSAASKAKLNSAALSVFIKDGDDWKRQKSGVTIANKDITANVPKGASAVLTTPLTNRLVLSKDAKPLNFWLPTTANQCEEFEIESYADPEPARWNKTSNEFETDVYVAIFRTNRNDRARLPSPVSVNLAGREAEVTPKALTFTNVAVYEKLRVAFGRNDVEARINMFPFTEEAPFVIPVRRLGGVDVRISPKSVLGYGLGVANLTFIRVDTRTNELSEGPIMNVDVEPTVARANSSMTIAAGESRTEMAIRSTGVQKDRVKISTGGYVREVELDYRSPWLFVVAVLLGGIIGGCARCLQKRNQNNNQLWRYLAEGCVAGLLAMAAVLAGVAFSVVPAGVAETELGAFLISAAVALVGITAISGLKKLVPKVGR